MENKKEKSSWLKEHADTSIVILTIVPIIIGAVIWMTSQFHSLDTKHTQQFYELKQEISTIKTVLMMKEIMPKEMCAVKQEKE
jgi:cell division protein FtsW (lipid II flippase)